MKMLLIATTALVCVTSLAMAATLPDRQIGSSHSGLTTNEEFLCNYGFTVSTLTSSSASGLIVWRCTSVSPVACITLQANWSGESG